MVTSEVMTAPTISAIDPATGHPGGQYLLRVEGANFQLPAPVAATGYVGGDVEETVQIEVDGELAAEVRVYSASLLTCLVPAFTGDPTDLVTGLAVDVTVRNLDSGPGPEETTYPALLTYQRTNLARGDGIVVRIIREFILSLRRQVLDNIVLSTEVAYDPETGGTADTVALAVTPGIALFGPSIAEDTFRRRPTGQAVANQAGTEYTRNREHTTVTLGFEGTIVTKDSVVELLNLVQEVVGYFKRNPWLRVVVDPVDPAQGTEELELWLITFPSAEDVVDLGGTRSASFACEIRGVPIDEDTLLPVGWGTILGDPADIQLTVESVED